MTKESNKRQQRGFVAAIVMLASLACAPPHEGLGLGRPNFLDRGSVAPLGVSIRRVYVPVAAAQNAYIELINTSDKTLDTAKQNITILSLSGLTQVADVVWEPGGIVQLGAANLAGLNLSPQLGEIAVFGPEMQMESYLAWGADPNLTPGSLAQLANQDGFTGAFVGNLGFPMAQNLAYCPAAFATQGASCVSSDTTLAPPFASIGCQSAAAATIIASRIVPWGADPSGSFVELTNISQVTVDVFGLQVCSRKGCRPLTFAPSAQANSTLAPAQKAVVRLLGQGAEPPDQPPTPDSATSILVTALPRLLPDDELAIGPPGVALNAEGATAPFAYVHFSLAQPLTGSQPATLLPTLQTLTTQALWHNQSVLGPSLPKQALTFIGTQANDALLPAGYAVQNF